MSEAALRQQLLRYSRAMHAAGWVANHDGNLSVRLPGAARMVCTPTALSKADVEPDDLVVIDAVGQRVSGTRRVFSEIGLHLAIYDARPEVGAVVHAHPPFATAFGVSGRALPHPFLPEAVVSLGASIPTVPLTLPGPPAVDALRPLVRQVDALLLAGNGVLTWGKDLETAYLRAELVEHLARIAHLALPLGGPTLLPKSDVDTLVARRHQAGLAAPEEPASPSGSPTSAARTSAARPNESPGAPVPGATHRAAAPTEDIASRAANRARAAMPNADPALVTRIAEQLARSMGVRE